MTAPLLRDKLHEFIRVKIEVLLALVAQGSSGAVT